MWKLIKLTEHTAFCDICNHKNNRIMCAKHYAEYKEFCEKFGNDLDAIVRKEAEKIEQKILNEIVESVK